MSNPGDGTTTQILPSANKVVASSPDGNRAMIGTPPPAPFRMLLVSLLAAAIGLVAGLIAFALYRLIGLFTNIFFFHRWSADFSSAQHNHHVQIGDSRLG